MADKNAEKANIVPYLDRLVIEALTEDEVSHAGIVLPDTVSKEKPQRGRVIAVGKGKRDDSGKYVSMDIKAGDIVLFTKYGPHEIKISGKEYLIANESDILAIVS
ncbi:co-chaperone GroES [Candidatus Peregrinibacteria bacterium RIFOXYC2_FULL_33_13]|nr:MAG: 10 kDa chaperonin [Candidatus Peregrinibacteria bacterium GW2011_GWA2_33_10]KKP39613.1 MAG: 10 kDa chaperonin, chaperonin GroES [Candidatus Peregrinibacteria bacterium GW2011_GWC2_33_13]OGJ50083.1 MAG: co-chaperone GroES [Candidatus Peregrinibacteria bacterium RIFOXYA2_FULL_33_7]OGJ55436.1 MAG: co-chaperone GroES [Candidatus Peregrinibacteria bacterium RIFOXYC2_FULL_33_13]